MRKIIVCGIDTKVGKTVVSAILVQMLSADYWKPIQAGSLDFSDTQKVKRWVSYSAAQFFPEAHRLSSPLSPHHASYLDGISIAPENIQIPQNTQTLIIETCGGVMTPLNDQFFLCDLFTSHDYEWILVSKNYLGSINHTLLALEYLKSRSLKVLGLIFNGEPNNHTESFILQHSKLPLLGRLFPEEEIDQQIILKYALLWQKNF